MRDVWWLADGARAALEARAPLDVAAWMQPGDDREVLSTDRQSAAVVWKGDAPLLVKWRAPIAGRRRRTWFRPSRERNEARAMQRAAALGIPVPSVLAVGERRAFGVLVGAVLVRPFDAEARPAGRAAREDPSVLIPLALALRSWHDAGLRHGDCYPKNILVGGAVDVPRPIGCPMASFVSPGPHLDRERLKDLGQFTAGCAALEPWSDPFGFLTTYADAPGLPEYEDLVAQVTPFYERVMERKALRERTRPQREPDGPPMPAPLAMGPKPSVRVRAL